MSNLQQTVVASAEKAQYDLQVKKLLGSKEIPSHILIKTVDEFKGMSPSEVAKCIEGDVHISTVPVDPGMTNKKTGDRITGLNMEDGEINEGYIRYDIIFYVLTKNGHSKIIVNVEAQKSEPDKYYLLNRGIFYASRMISSQKERDFVDMNYNDLHQVYSLSRACLGT